MASTDILISSDNFRTVTPDSVSFAVGDSITISATEDAPSILTFSAAAQAILAPKPDLQVTVSSSQAQSFRFSSDRPGIYTIAVADAEFGGSIDDGGGDATPSGGSTSTLQFVVVPVPAAMPPPQPVSSVGPIFHPNSGG